MARKEIIDEITMKRAITRTLTRLLNVIKSWTNWF